jgi:integral membrane protein
MKPVTFLRRIALAEATSYLLLLGIAMPLKYMAGMPMAVKVVGWIHGVLFVLFCWALLQVLRRAGWPVSRCALVFALSFIPLVPFFFDRRMKEWEQSQAA